MSLAEPAGVCGLRAYQELLDKAGQSAGQVGSVPFESSKAAFSEVLNGAVRKAADGAATAAGVPGEASQGNIINTGNALDLAIEGKGYFVLSDGSRELFSRTGSFGVDAQSNLVDRYTGYVVQRIGSTGQSDGFQMAGSSNVKIPYGAELPGKGTSTVAISGNLSADARLAAAKTNELTSNITYTAGGGVAAEDTKLVELDQFRAAHSGRGSIVVSGLKHDGTAINDAAGFVVSDTAGMRELIEHINSVLGSNNATASLVDGRIRVTDVEGGYSKSDVKLTYTPAGTESFRVPGYFELTKVGADELKDVSITIYDSQGCEHIVSGAFVRTNSPGQWDLALRSVSGDTAEMVFDKRRIEGISFGEDGLYRGITGSGSAEFAVTFGPNNTQRQTIAVELGTAGQFDGLTQFAGSSTAVARDQDGHEAGTLAAITVNNEGVIIGAFTNGVRKEIGCIQIAVFSNALGLEDVGGGYFVASGNSGAAAATQALRGAGSIYSGALEKSSTDVVTDFVNMIRAQSGFEANARTIRAANDALRQSGRLSDKYEDGSRLI